jgi:hypothetical protein
MVAGWRRINNPLAFVSNNVAVLQRDIGGIPELLKLYREPRIYWPSIAELLEEIRDLSSGWI